MKAAIKALCEEGLILNNETIKDGSSRIRRYAYLGVTEIDDYVPEEAEDPLAPHPGGKRYRRAYFGKSYYEFHSQASQTWYGPGGSYCSNLDPRAGFETAEEAAEEIARIFGVVAAGGGYAVTRGGGDE